MFTAAPVFSTLTFLHNAFRWKNCWKSAEQKRSVCANIDELKSRNAIFQSFLPPAYNSYLRFRFSPQLLLFFFKSGFFVLISPASGKCIYKFLRRNNFAVETQPAKRSFANSQTPNPFRFLRPALLFVFCVWVARLCLLPKTALFSLFGKFTTQRTFYHPHQDIYITIGIP